jgi:hypothetical protein
VSATARVHKRFPAPCPNCGDRHEVYLPASDVIVDARRVDTDIDWAEDYPRSEGYRYHYKKCPAEPKVELRVIVEAE